MRINSKTSSKYLLILVLVYIFSQILLIFISGQWWDDWIIWCDDVDGIKRLFLESGCPWEAYNLFSVMWIPNWGYRIVVFFLFLLSGIIFFFILCKMDFISEEDAFWMSAVAMTVPINDARATLICYGYSLSLTLFMLAFFCVTRLSDMEGGKKLLLRMVSLICLLYSYTMESLLVFTGLIWLYLFYDCWNKNKDNRIIKKVKLFLKSYWDYLGLPFIFFIIKGIFFKPYGRYEGYNDVTIKSLLKGTSKSPLATLKTGAIIGRSYLLQVGLISIIVFIAVVMIYCYAIKNKYEEASVKDFTVRKRNILIFILGAIVYYTGIFAYVVVRGGRSLGSTGVGGRDAMLAGFGIGIMVVAFARFIPIKRVLQNLIPLFFIVFGIFHFNDWYLSYQEDWYQLQEVAKTINDNNAFGDDNTILCDFSVSSPNGGTRFYSINGLYYSLTGKMDKFYFCGISDLHYGGVFNEYLLDGYNCDEYDPSDRTIDGVLVINNAPLDNIDLIKMRFNEIFNHEKYEKGIAELTDNIYITINKDLSDTIYAAYTDGTLTSEVLRNMVGVQ